jgi:UDP-N-acetyl-2-amino-2-deoxyglucuronate dehydrogenase
MGKERLNVALLGCGGIVGSHRRGFDENRESCRVVAVAEPRRERHAFIRESFGSDVEIVADYHDVLAMDMIDGVDIVLPHDQHMPATVAAAEAGKHVLVEKVMARNVWECDRMIETCDRAGVTLTVCHDRRYNSEWGALKEVVDSGALGEVFLWKLDHNQDVLPPPGHWIRTRDGIGGGAIMSCLTHQIDALRWYGGEVASVNCMTRVIPERMEGEFLGMLHARMSSGALAELSINWWTRSRSGSHALWYEMVQVCGTAGEAYYMNGRGTYVKLHGSAGDAAVVRFGEEALREFVEVPNDGQSGHVVCIGEWIKLLRGESADIRTAGRDCRGTVEVAEAAYLAERERREISLPIESAPWCNRSAPETIQRQFTDTNAASGWDGGKQAEEGSP